MRSRLRVLALNLRAGRVMKRQLTLVVFLVACATGVAWGSLSLNAQPESLAACCSSQGECGEGLKCCDAGLMGVEPCGDEPNYCLSQCIRPAQN